MIIDPQIAGISGDMILCSLVDLGADKQKIIEGIKKSEKYFYDSIIQKIDFQKIQKHGIQATQLSLSIEEDTRQRKVLKLEKPLLIVLKSLNFPKKQKPL